MADQRVVTAWAEADLAVRLGATPAEAVEVVRTLLDEDLLPHGVATIAAVAAARWGIPMDEAVPALAGGRPLRGDPSDYELRVGAEEAEDDLADLRADDRDVTQREDWAARGLVDRSVPASPHHVVPA